MHYQWILEGRDQYSDLMTSARHDLEYLFGILNHRSPPTFRERHPRIPMPDSFPFPDTDLTNFHTFYYRSSYTHFTML